MTAVAVRPSVVLRSAAVASAWPAAASAAGCPRPCGVRDALEGVGESLLAGEVVVGRQQGAAAVARGEAPAERLRVVAASVDEALRGAGEAVGGAGAGGAGVGAASSEDP